MAQDACCAQISLNVPRPTHTVPRHKSLPSDHIPESNYMRIMLLLAVMRSPSSIEFAFCLHSKKLEKQDWQKALYTYCHVVHNNNSATTKFMKLTVFGWTCAQQAASALVNRRNLTCGSSVLASYTGLIKSSSVITGAHVTSRIYGTNCIAHVVWLHKVELQKRHQIKLETRVENVQIYAGAACIER